MPKIKTREKVRGIKTLDKAAVAGERMRETYIRSKERVAGLTDDHSENPNAYAGDKVQQAAENVARDTARVAASGAKLAAIKGTAAIKQRKESQYEPMMGTMRSDPLTAAKEQFIEHVKDARREQQSAFGKSSCVLPETEREYSVYNLIHVRHGDMPIKQKESVPYAERLKTKASVSPKTKQLRIKSATRQAQSARKTAQYATAVRQRSAETAAKTAELSAQSIYQSVKQSTAMSKRAAETTKEVLRAMIVGMRSTVAALAAGSGVTCMVIIVVCLIGMMSGSCFGIFFSGEDSGTGMTMRDAAREINAEYNEKIEKIKKDHPYDELNLSGSKATWPEMLSIYAVKATSDQRDGQEVASMNDMKLELLRKVFWDMNDISYHVERHAVGSGKDMTTVVSLCITVSHRTTAEVSKQYGFNADQKKQLDELLSEQYRPLWRSVLYGIGTGNGDIVTVALSQLGDVGGETYWSWYGFTSREEWCACFVSWCANECGYIDAGIIPRFAWCNDGSNWFKARNQWQERDYEPYAGDIIFFDWDGDEVLDHVGIVVKTENGMVYTVEGNSGDCCRENCYLVGNVQIYGYGVPMYS